ncbi:MAG: anti-sigma factor [Acidobacteriota bacterium]|nr:anti-sigma factor [Acidobacteriota bacterium]
MRCDKAERLISDGLDGALGDSRRERLDAHLAACPRCRAYADSLAQMQTAAKSVAPLSPEPERMARSLARLQAGLRGAAAEKTVSVPFARLRWAPAGALAALLVAAAGLYFAFLRPSPTADFVPYFYSYSDSRSGLAIALAEDEALASAFDSAIGEALIENGASAVLAGEPLRADAGRFLDSLTDDEILLLESAIQDGVSL